MDSNKLADELEALHNAAKGREFDLTPADGPIAKLTLFMHENGERILAALRQPTPEADPLQQALEDSVEIRAICRRDVPEAATPEASSPGEAMDREWRVRADTLARLVCDMVAGGEHGWEECTDEQFNALCKQARKVLATVSPSPDVVGLLTDIRDELRQAILRSSDREALAARIDNALNRLDATTGADHG